MSERTLATGNIPVYKGTAVWLGPPLTLTRGRYPGNCGNSYEAV